MVLLLPLAYSWRNVLARKGSTGVTLAGVAVSVAVFVVITATADGLSRVATTTGDPANLIVLSKGASSARPAPRRAAGATWCRSCATRRGWPATPTAIRWRARSYW